jgi:hypothetical protein
MAGPKAGTSVTGEPVKAHGRKRGRNIHESDESYPARFKDSPGRLPYQNARRAAALVTRYQRSSYVPGGFQLTAPTAVQARPARTGLPDQGEPLIGA